MQYVVVKFIVVSQRLTPRARRVKGQGARQGEIVCQRGCKAIAFPNAARFVPRNLKICSKKSQKMLRFAWQFIIIDQWFSLRVGL